MWATEPHEEIPIKIGTEGASAAPPKTVFNVFKKCVEEHGENTALKFQKVSEVKWGIFAWNITVILPETFHTRFNRQKYLFVSIGQFESGEQLLTESNIGILSPSHVDSDP